MIQIGVLIIGSLYWDMKKHRSKWRRKHLECQHLRYVRVPIRYGRRSCSRGCSYTMVISAGLGEDQFGCGIVIPCKSQNLINEAECLWTAERPDDSKPNGRISASWGRIALLVNRDSPEANKIRDEWKERVSRESNYVQSIESAVGEKAAVNKCGFLNIPWPKTKDGSELEFDAILATATNPKIVSGAYADVQNIADAWKTSDGKRFVCYFYNNQDCGIKTFQDNDIESLL